jgi:thiamine-phosphate pyrophosphorylase
VNQPWNDAQRIRVQDFNGCCSALWGFATWFGGCRHNSILADKWIDDGKHPGYNRVAMLLYYITDRKGFDGSEPERQVALLKRIGEAARAGVDSIQLREKDLSIVDLELLAREALQVVGENSATTKLLINTHAEIALATGADGVHLPAGSPPASAVRAAWFDHSRRAPVIGVSAHSVADVRLAEADGADFAVLAPIFEKRETSAKGIGLEVLRKACAKSRLPVLALGGVNLMNAPGCLDAGAVGVAAIRLFQQGEVAVTVERLRELAQARQ